MCCEGREYGCSVLAWIRGSVRAGRMWLRDGVAFSVPLPMCDARARRRGLEWSLHCLGLGSWILMPFEGAALSGPGSIGANY